jgi:hypothetical protein
MESSLHSIDPEENYTEHSVVFDWVVMTAVSGKKQR